MLLLRWLLIAAIFTALLIYTDDGKPRCYAYDSGQVSCEYGP